MFVSHASEDKDAFVRPLVAALNAVGLKVWFDEQELRVGDSLRHSIDRGLARSRYGVVVISPAFLAKHWPQKELDGLVAREEDGAKEFFPSGMRSLLQRYDGARRRSQTAWQSVQLAELRKSAKGLLRVVRPA